MMALRPAWLTARPIAHRGLHDSERGILENTAAAAQAAIEAGFAIECDVQLSADGAIMVFHDFRCERLLQASGEFARLSAKTIEGLAFRQVGGSVPRLSDFLTLIAGRVPLICEIKSRFNGDLRLAERLAGVIGDYAGPLAIKSFDPAIIVHLRANPHLLGSRPRPLGVVGLRRYDDPEWAEIPAQDKHALANFLHYRESQPDFLSYSVEDLDSAVPFLLRQAAGLPVMSWTVCTDAQRRKARQFADQMIFEGFVPTPGE
jgi:glycerophosphoryl diester phosphodiesterase